MFVQKSSVITWFFLCLLAAFLTRVNAAEVHIYDFPLQAYKQNIDFYLPADSADYNKPLLSLQYQKSQTHEFFRHYYASDLRTGQKIKTGLEVAH